MNGGKRLYVSRVFAPRGPAGAEDWGVASRAIAVSGTTATWRARWPGAYGNVWVETQVVRSKNIAFVSPTFGGIVQVTRAKRGSIVEIITAGDAAGRQRSAHAGQSGRDRHRSRSTDNSCSGAARARFCPRRRTSFSSSRCACWSVSNAEPRGRLQRAGRCSRTRCATSARFSSATIPEDEDAVVWLDWTPPAAATDVAANLLVALQQNTNRRLEGGHDGVIVVARRPRWATRPIPTTSTRKATGLEALGEIDDIAIVALPDGGAYDDEVELRSWRRTV